MWLHLDFLSVVEKWSQEDSKRKVSDSFTYSFFFSFSFPTFFFSFFFLFTFIFIVFYFVSMLVIATISPIWVLVQNEEVWVDIHGLQRITNGKQHRWRWQLWINKVFIWKNRRPQSRKDVWRKLQGEGMNEQIFFILDFSFIIWLTKVLFEKI